MRLGMVLELGIVGAAMVAAGVFFMTRPADAGTKRPDAVSTFTANDFAAFDREFVHGDMTCAVGLKAEKICFGGSPHEAKRYADETLPKNIPAISAEFPVIVALDLKTDGLKTIRFGNTLALYVPESRKVVDVIDLSAPSYKAARRATPLIGS